MKKMKKSQKSGKSQDSKRFFELAKRVIRESGNAEGVGRIPNPFRPNTRKWFIFESTRKGGTADEIILRAIKASKEVELEQWRVRWRHFKNGLEVVKPFAERGKDGLLRYSLMPEMKRGGR